MNTTIQVSRKTPQLLNMLKRKLSARSYGELLRRIVAEKLNLPVSLFSFNPKLKPFKEEGETEFHEL